MPLKFGVPQGSDLGPVIFTIYTQPLVSIFKKYNIQYHLFADDTQLYIFGDVANIPDLSKRMS